MASNQTGVRAIPMLPEKDYGSAVANTATKIATPDLIEIDQDPIPEDIVVELLFEKIGGIEIINISRNDIVNGQNVSYNLIGNTGTIERLYNSENIFKLSGTSKEFFDNFGIRFGIHVPDNGTSPAPAYIDLADAVPGVSVKVKDRITGTTLETFTNYQDAEDYINQTYPIRDIVYVDQTTGNIVVDVTKMELNERVDIEVQASGTVQDDTIY